MAKKDQKWQYDFKIKKIFKKSGSHLGCAPGHWVNA